jgi:hypothetical protein
VVQWTWNAQKRTAEQVAERHQFESQPTKTPRRYEHILNARPERAVVQSEGLSGIMPL